MAYRITTTTPCHCKHGAACCHAKRGTSLVVSTLDEAWQAAHGIGASLIASGDLAELEDWCASLTDSPVVATFQVEDGTSISVHRDDQEGESC